MILPKIKHPIVSWKGIFKAELIFLLFIAFSTIKLTGTQYIITSTSGFPLWKMALRNVFFLYFLWRLSFLFKKPIITITGYILQTFLMGLLLLIFQYSGEIVVLSQLVNIKEGFTALNTLSTVIFKWSNLILFVDLPILIFISELVVSFINNGLFIVLVVLVISIL